MYGIRDNRQWIGQNNTLTFSPRNALKFETFDEAQQYLSDNNLEFFIAVRF